MSKKVDMDYKIIILGMSEVGKTCLLINYFDKKFQESNISTIGVDFKTKYFKFNEKKVKVNYVDTAGQERFHSIASNFLKNANGILLVYAVNSRISFDKLQEWVDEVNKFANNSYVANLYQFNLIIQAMNINVQMLESIKDLEIKLQEKKKKRKK